MHKGDKKIGHKEPYLITLSQSTHNIIFYTSYAYNLGLTLIPDIMYYYTVKPIQWLTMTWYRWLKGQFYVWIWKYFRQFRSDFHNVIPTIDFLTWCGWNIANVLLLAKQYSHSVNMDLKCSLRNQVKISSINIPAMFSENITLPVQYTSCYHKTLPQCWDEYFLGVNTWSKLLRSIAAYRIHCSSWPPSRWPLMRPLIEMMSPLCVHMCSISWRFNPSRFTSISCEQPEDIH